MRTLSLYISLSSFRSLYSAKAAKRRTLDVAKAKAGPSLSPSSPFAIAPMPVSFPAHSPVVWAVGTTNNAKLRAVYTTARKLYPLNRHVIFAFSVDSGVSDQPMSAEETQRGAVNRATGALEAALDTIAAAGSLNISDSQNAKLSLENNKNDDDGGADSHEWPVKPLTVVHFGVGLEGGIEAIGERFFECGWMAVAALTATDADVDADVDANPSRSAFETGTVRGKEGRRYTIGLGSSARFEMSEVLMRKIIHEQKELATVMDELTGETDLRSTLGAMGVLTAGHLGRAAAYEHGMIFAMARFLSDKLFWEA